MTQTVTPETGSFEEQRPALSANEDDNNDVLVDRLKLIAAQPLSERATALEQLYEELSGSLDR